LNKGADVVGDCCAASYWPTAPRHAPEDVNVRLPALFIDLTIY